MAPIRSALIVVLLLNCLLSPPASDAQPAASPRKIGFVSVSPEPQAPQVYPYLKAFQQGLRERGWMEGQNLAVEYRWAAGRAETVPDFARELVRLNVDLIVTYGNKPPHMMKDVVKTTPIVALSCDPLEIMVTNLARPTGNITEKLELLLDVAPSVRKIAILYNPNDPGPALALRLAQEFATRRQVKIDSIAVATPEEFDHALLTIAQLHTDALYVYPDQLTARFAKATIAFAAKHRLPAIYEFRQWPEAGGLMSYGSNLGDLASRAAGYVDKILKGAKPTDLPIEQPTKFELVINLATAKALGLTIPPSLLLRADEVIQPK